MKFIHPQTVIQTLYLSMDKTLLFRDNEKVPTPLRGKPVPHYEGFYFVGIGGIDDYYLSISLYVPLLEMTCTESYPIDTPHQELPSMWETWFLKNNEGNFYLGNEYIFHVEGKMAEPVPRGITKARKLAICTYFYEYLQSGLGSTQAQENTARLFGCSLGAVRKAWTDRPAGVWTTPGEGAVVHTMGEKKRSVLNHLETRIKATKRTPEYKVYSAAVSRAMSRVYETYRTTFDPLFEGASFGVRDFLIEGRLPVLCPVLGIRLDYSGLDIRSLNTVNVWRKDVTLPFIAGNMTVMCRAAALMIENQKVNARKMGAFLAGTEGALERWRQWNESYKTNMLPL